MRKLSKLHSAMRLLLDVIEAKSVKKRVADMAEKIGVGALGYAFFKGEFLNGLLIGGLFCIISVTITYEEAKK